MRCVVVLWTCLEAVGTPIPRGDARPLAFSGVVGTWCYSSSSFLVDIANNPSVEA